MIYILVVTILVQVELMCLFSHGRCTNEVCNEPILKAITMSLFGKTTLKGKQCTATNIVKVLATIKDLVKLETEPLIEFSMNTLTLVSR